MTDEDGKRRSAKCCRDLNRLVGEAVELGLDRDMFMNSAGEMWAMAEALKAVRDLQSDVGEIEKKASHLRIVK